MYKVKRFSQMTEQKEFNSKAQKFIRTIHDKTKALEGMSKGPTDVGSFSKNLNEAVSTLKKEFPKSKDPLSDLLKREGRYESQRGMVGAGKIRFKLNRLKDAGNPKVNHAEIIKGTDDVVDVKVGRSALPWMEFGDSKSLHDKINKKGDYSRMRDAMNNMAYEVSSKGGKDSFIRTKNLMKEADNMSDRIKFINKIKHD